MGFDPDSYSADEVGRRFDACNQAIETYRDSDWKVVIRLPRRVGSRFSRIRHVTVARLVQLC